nr:hypothetical protein [Mycobacterium intracellulare]
MLLVASIIGAFWGAAFGFIAHASTRGKRDFSSVQALEAQRYDVYVAAQYAAEAAARFVPGSRVDDSDAARTGVNGEQRPFSRGRPTHSPFALRIK